MPQFRAVFVPCVVKIRTACQQQRPAQAWRHTILIGFLLGLCVSALSANAALRYVDSAVASSGNGQSWATAWKTVGNITGLAAGDTVYFSGGSTTKNYAVSNWTPAGGASGNPITYRAGQDAGHNGIVRFQGSGAVRWIYGNVSNVTIDGSYNGVAHFFVDGDTYQYDYIIYMDYSGTTRFKLLYVNWTHGQVWMRGADYLEIAYCTGTPPANGGGEDSMWNHIGEQGAATGWGINSFHHNTMTLPRKKTAGQGWDCLKWCGNIDVYNNRFIAVYNASYTGTQHGDGWQGNGDYTRIFNNYYENWISYPILLEAYGNSAHWRIYNNVFYSGNESGIDWAAHQAIAIGFNPGAPGTFTDFIIANNSIIGNGSSRGIHFNYPSAGTIGANCYVVNNLIYNSQSSVLTAGGSPTVSNNTAGNASGLSFLNLATYPSGDFHLIASSTSAIDKGISPSYLSAIFTTDSDGNARTGTWDIGAYEFGAGTPSTNPVISVSPSSLSFGSVAAGTTNDLTFTVRNAGAGTLSGSATVTQPFSILSGGTYSLGSQQSQIVTVRYVTGGVGTFSQTVTFTGGGGATASVSGSVLAVLPGLSFESFAGAITAPFVTNSGRYISQPAETGVTDGGRAAYTFSITNAGDYIVTANINAAADTANSIFINVDAEPTDPTMIWDIPLTTGFESRTVSWRGNGTFDNNQYVPAVFTLAAGAHQLIVRGREADVQLGRISISPSGNRPAAPSNLRVAGGF